MPTLVITGGSGGIGKATAQLFAQHHWRVFELSRHGESSENITHLFCDVTKKKSIEQAIQQVILQVDYIDVVISNAGMGISGPLEFATEEDLRTQMDVNFFGAIFFIQSVLPILRRQKHGTIIITSSVAAVLSVPYQSVYSASKAALNAISLALQNEVRDFNIHVSCLMPGDVATGFTQARNKSESGYSVYTRADKAISTMEKDEQNGLSPMSMARIMWRIANKKSPAPFYVGGFLYKIFCLLDRVLPKRLVNWIEGKMY